MSKFNNFKQWIFENLFPAFYQTNDTYKDEEGKGIIQRFIEVCAEYLDNEVQPGIDTAMDNIDFDKAQLIFLNQLWEYFDSIPYAYGVLVNNEKYDPENIQRWFNSALGFPKADPRRILRYAISLFKIRGTDLFYQILGRLYGVEISLEAAEIASADIDHIEYGPIILVTFTYLDQSELVVVPADGATNVVPTVEWYQQYTIYYTDGREIPGTLYNNGSASFDGNGEVAEYLNTSTGEISEIPANESFTNYNHFGTVILTIVSNGQVLDASIEIQVSAQEDYIVKSSPTSISLRYTDYGTIIERSYIILDASNSPVYPIVTVDYTSEMRSGGIEFSTIVYNITYDNTYSDIFKFIDESSLGFMDQFGIVSAEATLEERLLATPQVSLIEDPSLTDDTQIFQKADDQIEFIQVSLTYDEIPAAGGVVYPKLTVIVSVDGGDPMDVSGVCNREYSGTKVNSSGAVSANSRGTVVGDRWIVDNVTLVVYYEGKSYTVTCDVYQEENQVEYQVSDVVAVLLDYTVPAGGGSADARFEDQPNVTVLAKYTSGVTTTARTYWYGDDPELTFAFYDTQGYVDINTGTVTVDGQRSTSETIAIDYVTLSSYTLTLPDGSKVTESINQRVNVYQEVNRVSPSVTLQPSSEYAEINTATYSGSFTLTTNSDCETIDMSADPWGTRGSVIGFLSITLNGTTYTANTNSIPVSANRSYQVTYEMDTHSIFSSQDFSIYFVPHGSGVTGSAAEYEIEITRING